MKIYKFRDFRSRDYLSDILNEERLFCARYQDLNDPFEGIFNISRKKRFIKRLDEEKTIELFSKNGIFTPVLSDEWEPIIDYNTLSAHVPDYNCTRVCSMTTSFDDVRLWSLYADSHKGCAVEIDIEPSPGLYSVKYVKSLSDIPQDKNVVLYHKSHHWSFEKEYRFITTENFISVKQKISSIQVGLRTSALDIDFLLAIAPSYTHIYSSELDPSRIRILRGKALR
jgi:hypothetical protein